MAALDNLPPDQRAVLQMVLQRGRSYDEIAALLAIDRAAVRQRALDAFDALTPTTVLPGPERALVTDYLLGQLPQRVAEQVHSYLEASPADREWARALADAIEPLASDSLPEIPVGAPLGADDWSPGGLERHSDPPEEPEWHTEPPEEPDWHRDAPEEPDWHRDAPEEPDWHTEPRPAPEEPAVAPLDTAVERPSSRRGGAILLGVVAALIAVAVVVAVLDSGGSGGKRHGAAQSKSAGHTTATGSGKSAGTSTGATTTGSGTQILAQLNLSSPTGASKTLGIVQVVRVKGRIGIVLDAQGVPANTTHNAYAVWLYNSPTSHKFVGFVQSLVGKSGKIVTEGELPSGASAYHRLLVTLETQSHPTSPGEVVLSGPFRERS